MCAALKSTGWGSRKLLLLDFLMYLPNNPSEIFQETPFWLHDSSFTQLLPLLHDSPGSRQGAHRGPTGCGGHLLQGGQGLDSTVQSLQTNLPPGWQQAASKGTGSAFRAFPCISGTPCVERPEAATSFMRPQMLLFEYCAGGA